MKRTLLLCFSVWMSLVSWSADFEEGGIYYNIVSDDEATCEVTYLQYETATPTYTGALTIPETVGYGNKTYTVIGIGNDAFDYCTFTSITLPETLEYIEEYAFFGCYVKSVKIPDSVTSVVARAFFKSQALEDVTIGNSVPKVEDHTFYECPCLARVTIGSSVTAVGEAAFFECTELESIEFPSSVLSIGQQAFQRCDKLVEVTFNESIESIGYMSFCQCPIEELVIPNSLTSLADGYAFRHCTNLKKVTIGSSVKSIGNSTFAGDTALEEVYSLNTTPPSCSNTAFSDVNAESCVLYVPKGTKGTYATANVWQDFQNIVEIDSDGIEAISLEDGKISDCYTINGQKISSPQHGVNIIRYADGTTKKVIMK